MSLPYIKLVIMKVKIEPIFLLNTKIEELEKLKLITTRVYLNIKVLGLKNFNELLQVIRDSETDKKAEKRLEKFGQRSVDEVNDLFKKAGISVPKYW